jgi:hypothetical protein
MSTQKLNAHHCKEHLRKFFFSRTRKKYGPSFFGENVNGIIYHDMLVLWIMSRLLQDKPDVFGRDGAPPHIHNEMTMFLNRQLSERWIGRWGSTY